MTVPRRRYDAITLGVFDPSFSVMLLLYLICCKHNPTHTTDSAVKDIRVVRRGLWRHTAKTAQHNCSVLGEWMIIALLHQQAPDIIPFKRSPLKEDVLATLEKPYTVAYKPYNWSLNSHA